MIFRTYESEEEQVEALREWWRENRLPLLAGIVFGLGGIFGYQTWQAHSRAQAATASALYETLRGDLESADIVAARSRAELLLEDHRNSPYAALGQLAIAKTEAEAGEYLKAAGHLDWVLRYADDGGLRDLARLRKARVLWAGGQPDEALKAIDGKLPEAFAAGVLELRGDILAASGQRLEAIAAYQDALNRINTGAPGDRELLNQKLTDLKQSGDA